MLLLAILGIGQVVSRADSTAGADRPRGNLVVIVQLDPGPYHVGQGVRLAVLAPEGNLKPPVVAGADLVPLKTGRPGEAQFVLVPRRAGMLEIGSFRVLVEDRLGGSKPTRMNVATIPANGRSAAFRGGVGSFQVTSQVEPAAIKVGQTVAYRITITGPAAWGSVQDVPLLGLPTGFQVRESATDLVPGAVPERTNRYRLRAIKPGRLVIPPAPVAAFDAGTGRFVTRSAPSQVVIVEAPPPFDPSTVDLGPIPAQARSARWQWVGMTLSGLGGLLLLGVGWKQRSIRQWLSNRSRRRPVRWQQEALALRRWVSTQARDGESIGAEIEARLARAIERSLGLSLAVLTPIDAEAAVVALTQTSQLASRTSNLVAWCDRLRFDPNANATVGDLEEVVAEAVAILQAIGHHAIVPNRLPTQTLRS